jgi:hypothetical protein
VTEDLWKYVCERAGGLKPNTDDVLEFTVTPDDSRLREGEIGSHLTGSHHQATASISDPQASYDEIIAMSETWLRENKIPESVRIWRTAEEREKGEGSKVINLMPKAAAIESIRKHFQGFENKTTCCWWRPEYGVFTVDSQEKGKEVQWDTQNGRQSLRDFKNSTTELSSDGIGLDCLVLVEAQSAHNERRFIVTYDTSEEEWRLHIYDWLHSKTLFVTEIVHQIPLYGKAFLSKPHIEFHS